MRAEVSASLCSPEDRPVSLKIDPVKLDAQLSGTPTISADPAEVELPEITVTVPEVTLELPNPTLTVTLGFGTNIEYLEDLLTFLKSLDADDAMEAVVLAEGLLALPGEVARALALPSLRAEAQLTLGDVKISADQALTIDTGRVRLHGVPVTDDVLPLKVSADLDNAGMTALLDGVRAALTGCLVLNGGDPPPAPPAPPATVLGVDVKVDANKKLLVLIIHGQGFGPVQGTVVLTQVGLSLTPVQFVSWTDQEIEVIFQPIPPPGAYAVTVTTAQGVSTQPLPVTVSG
jgi:hypothetical protein